MSTYVAKPAMVEKKWVLIDAEGLVVGRLAALIATRLKGKHKPIYTPHVDCGDNIVVVNAEKVVFTGAKREDKVYYNHTGYPGGIKERTPRQILASKRPEMIVEKAVERMLARGPLHRQLMRNLRVYKGSVHPHEAQNPEKLDVAKLNRKNQLLPNRATNTLERLTSLIEQLDNINNIPEREQKAPLTELATLIPNLDPAVIRKDDEARLLLRGLPNKLLQILAEKIDQPDIAKSASCALAVTVNPKDYRASTLDRSEGQIASDLERLFSANRIGCFSKVYIKSMEGNRATIVAQLWNGLPFSMTGRQIKFTPPNWLQNPQTGKMAIEVIGAEGKGVRNITPKFRGQLAVIEEDFEFEPDSDPNKISLNLRWNNAIFERYTLRRSSQRSSDKTRQQQLVSPSLR